MHVVHRTYSNVSTDHPQKGDAFLLSGRFYNNLPVPPVAVVEPDGPEPLGSHTFLEMAGRVIAFIIRSGTYAFRNGHF